jgi:hypothetical protein
MSARKPGKTAAPAFVRVGSDKASQEQALADASVPTPEPEVTAAGAVASAVPPAAEAAPVYGWVCASCSTLRARVDKGAHLVAFRRCVLFIPVCWCLCGFAWVLCTIFGTRRSEMDDDVDLLDQSSRRAGAVPHSDAALMRKLELDEVL